MDDGLEETSAEKFLKFINEKGGPAYPGVVEVEEIKFTFYGMTLRDYFAGQALIGLARHREGDPTWVAAGVEHAAKTAYEIADAMLRARVEGEDV
jgi:hypothetical protein